MAYANPDAVTQIGNGLSTTTFQFDNDGNVIQKTTDGTTTTYIYDYANRLTALGVAGATTTYSYDAFGARVLQTGTTTTTFYPFKWYSVASSTGSGAKYATTTSYVFNGDTLLATVDQQTASGVATGTAQTSFIHPDYLGSTNVVTDQNDNLVQTLDYFPYGATRVSVATSTNEKRKYIDQFSDDSGLSYLNARYYNPSQGQFTSEEPIFLSIGDPSQVKQLSKQDQQSYLSDPQLLNSYSYGRDNPITRKDPTGKSPLILGGAIAGAFYGVDQQLQYDLASGQTSSVPAYVAAGLQGVGQGAAAAASISYLGPVTALEYYGYYQTYQGLRDFNEQLLSKNSTNYTEQQQRMTAGGVWLDGVQRIASAFTPMPIRAGYDAATSILYSLIQISNQLSSMQNKPQSSSSNYQTGAGRSSGGGVGSSKSGNASVSSVSTWMGDFNPFSPH